MEKRKRRTPPKTADQRIADLEKTTKKLEGRIGELEKENALMMRALARLAEEKAEDLGIVIPGTTPETSTN